MKSKIAMALRQLHRSESRLADDLVRVSDRHRTDHEIYFVARDLARWSRQHVAEIARVGRDHRLKLDPDPETADGPSGAARRRVSEAVGRRTEPGVLLLADLRHIYREASGVSADWEVVAQAAQARRDESLLALAMRCHPETLRQARWANGKLKESAAQVLAS